MTCVAWDGKTLAADKRGVCPDGHICTITKIRKKGNLLYGIAGAMSIGLDLMRWIEEGRDPASYPGEDFNIEEQLPTELIIIEKTKSKIKILKYEHLEIPVVIEDKIFAIGSGAHYALAAMACGKTAKEAVEVAAQFDITVGNGVDELTFK